jgi:hypothetical protein
VRGLPSSTHAVAAQIGRRQKESMGGEAVAEGEVADRGWLWPAEATSVGEGDLLSSST